MFWCFFYLKGLTGWLCFIVYFAFMCMKHAMTWLQPKDLRWSSRWCVSHLEKLSFYSSWIYLWHHLFISAVLWIFHFENCHFCNVRCLFALLIPASEISDFKGRCFAYFDATLARLSAVSLSGISLCAGHDCSNHSDLETEGE